MDAMMNKASKAQAKYYELTNGRTGRVHVGELKDASGLTDAELLQLQAEGYLVLMTQPGASADEDAGAVMLPSGVLRHIVYWQRRI